MDECGREVEPPPHAARIGLQRPIGRVGESEALEQLARPVLGQAPRQVIQGAHEPEVLPAGEHLVDGGVLAGEADAEPDGLRMAGDVDAEHGRVALLERDDGREDAHGGRLAGAVGAEEPQHRAGIDAERHAVERDDLAELLADVLHHDGCVGHVGILAHIT